MRRRALALGTTVAVAAAAFVAPTGASAAKGFKFGVSASEVRSNSAILWARSAKPGRVLLEVRRKGSFGGCGGRGALPARATRANDLTVRKAVGRLKPGKSYKFRWCRRGGRRAAKSSVGRFKTAPPPGANRTIRFGLTGDMDAARAPGTNRPFWNNFEVLNVMRAAGNDFNVLLGDTIYSDSEVAGVVTRALTVRQKWGKYKLNLGMRPLQRLRSSAGTYFHWDDHEFINDFSPNDTPSDLGIPFSTATLYNRSLRAFQDYQPTTFSRSNGIYRTVRWGKNLELFFLDERSFRSAKADTGSTCDNPPGSGDPDIAPTAPQSNRNVFAPFLPQLGNPVPASCTAEINDPNRTFLGAAQLARFKAAINASTATWKVVVNELPLQQLYANPYDRWEGYESERDEVINYVKANVENVLFLSTDIHGNLVNEASTCLLECPGPIPAGLQDISTGPIATKSFERQIDDVGGGPGFGEAVRSQFLKPAPHNGLEAECAAINEFSYAQVTVTPTQLRVQLLDQGGTPVREGTFGGQGECPNSSTVTINAS